MKIRPLILFLAVTSMTISSQAQVIKVPQWKALMGERGWPVYFSEAGKVGILNTWGSVSEVDIMKFTEQEYQQIKKWGVLEKSVFIERLVSGELTGEASDKREQFTASKRAARANASKIQDEVHTVNYASQNQTGIRFSDGSKGTIAPGGLQMQGTVTVSHFNERAAELAKAGGYRQAEHDQTTYIKVLTEYRNTQMKKMKSNGGLKK